MSEKVKLSVEVSGELDTILEQLAKETHGTKSDVLRKGIALMQVAVEAKRDGLRFGVVDKELKLSKELVGIV